MVEPTGPLYEWPMIAAASLILKTVKPDDIITPEGASAAC
jgi:hypothetical protein